MGRGVVVANLGEGLYQIRLLFDTTAIARELARLTEQAAQSDTVLAAAQRTLLLYQAAAIEARQAVAAVLEQWQTGLIAAGKAAPELEPDPLLDPETGAPWEDPDRAQDAPLFAACNAARAAQSVAALTRVAALDLAAREVVRAGTDPLVAADRAGYTAALASRHVAAGASTPAAAVAQWARPGSALLSAKYTEAGVAYRYDARSAEAHHWCIVLAAPGVASVVVPPDDPAKTAARREEATLDTIELPRPDTLEPEQLQAVVVAYGIAQAKVHAAQREVDRLLAEAAARRERRKALTLIGGSVTVYAWHCRWVPNIAIGAEVETAEVPGWLERLATPANTTMGVRKDPNFIVPDRTVSYVESYINVVEGVADLGDAGALVAAEGLSDAGAFVNAALEPGHWRWRPTYRYGTLTSFGWDTCSVTLDAIGARTFSGEPTLPLDEDLTLTNIPLDYCYEAFTLGAAVLVHFDEQDRNLPRVIGFRREPMPCPEGGRQSWAQYV